MRLPTVDRNVSTAASAHSGVFPNTFPGYYMHMLQLQDARTVALQKIAKLLYFVTVFEPHAANGTAAAL
ncbi:MAG: hypothetical protein ACK55I_00610, partial [bacterium]